MKHNGVHSALQQRTPQVSNYQQHAQSPQSQYPDVLASEHQVNGKKIRRNLRSDSRDQLEDENQSKDDQIYGINTAATNNFQAARPKDENINDEERESQQLFYEDNGVSDDMISNNVLDNKQEIDRILCSTKYDSQTKFKLLQSIIRRTTGQGKRPQTGTTRDKASLQLRKRGVQQRQRVQTSYKNRLLMDDYNMGMVAQQEMQHSGPLKIPTIVKNQRPVTSQTRQSYQTIDYQAATYEKSNTINLNSDKPKANRKKYYEDINTTATSQRKQFLPSEFDKQAIRTGAGAQKQREMFNIQEEQNPRQSKQRAQTAKYENFTGSNKRENLVSYQPFSGNIGQALKRQGVELGSGQIQQDSRDGFNSTQYKYKTCNINTNNENTRQQRDRQTHQTPYTDSSQNWNQIKSNPSRVATILSSIAFDKQEKADRTAKNNHNTVKTIENEPSQTSELGGRVYQKFIKIRKVLKRPTITQIKSSNNAGFRSQASITDDVKEQRLQDMQHKLQEKFGDQLLFEEELRDRHVMNSIGSIRSHTPDSNSKSRGSRSRSHSKKQSNFARSTSLIQKLTQNQNMPVSNKTMLLINSSEVLARDGIHGKIAHVGLGFGTGRHTASRHQSVQPIERVQQALAPRSISPPPKKDRAISAHSYRSPVQISIGLSPKSQFSNREKNEQVTNGRFEPDQFNEQCQTSEKLLKNYLQKPTRVNETETDPVNIVPKKKTATYMVQTDPLVDEVLHMMEPYSLNLPKEFPSKLDFEKLLPGAQAKVTIDLPQPLEEDKRDWSESALYMCIKNISMATFLKKGLIQATEGRPIKVNETIIQNLNPLLLPILSNIEVDYIIDRIRSETKQQEYKITIQELEKWFTAAKVTIEVLVANMVNPEVVNHIFFAYYQTVTQNNVIKLLIRARKLYQARQMASSILSFATDIQLLHEPRSILYNLLMNVESEEEITDSEQLVIRYVTKKIDRALAITDTFVLDNVISKKGFVFQREDFKESLVLKSQILLGYWLLRSKLNKQSDEVLIQVYNDWRQENLQLTGLPKNPTQETIAKILLLEKNGSRVMKVIAEIPPTPVQEKFTDHLYLRPHVFIDEAKIQDKSVTKNSNSQSDLDDDNEDDEKSNKEFKVPALNLNNKIDKKPRKLYSTASEKEMKQLLKQKNGQNTEFTVPQSVKSNIQSQLNGSLASY